MEVLALVAKGYANKEVAGKFNISYGTVQIHLRRCLQKLHVRCRTEAVAKLLRSVPNSASVRQQPAAT